MQLERVQFPALLLLRQSEQLVALAAQAQSSAMVGTACDLAILQVIPHTQKVDQIVARRRVVPLRGLF